MKVLPMFVDEFIDHSATKNLQNAEIVSERANFFKAILAFIYIEQTDEENDVNLCI